ncbi:hypothetical protein C8E03_103203 [Lachnotalea glycerini]|uniref:ABC-2 family transporter n=1 Tax=Lachnotalea glycerini TaxID=1763509 RepID=A0A255I9J3_9FIRM|nr:hypothetical protein [Lachnotalea glycerini]PXV91645.1 hypothetical protein C8E03_103203 [Lachnotalea glycerini]RDY30801.1 hypothetical protein CG710_012940 [Lachnotalea glycerini]
MRIFFVILKKEFKNFQVRKAMKKWYCMMIAILLILPFVKYDIAILNTHEKSCLYISMLLTLLIPNTLSLDVIGGEKYHRTLITLISAPIKIRTIILGKVSFITILSALYAFIAFIITNLELRLFYKTSMHSIGLEWSELLNLYLMLICFVIIIAFLGSILSLTIRNLKLSGYFVSVVGIGIVLLIYKAANMSKLYMNYFLLTAELVVVILFFISSFVTKQRVMKIIN